MRKLIVLLIGLLLFVLTGCAGQAPGSQWGPGDADAAVKPQPATAPDAEIPSEIAAPTPPEPPGDRQRIVDEYLKLTHGNVPGSRPINFPDASQCYIMYGGTLKPVSSNNGKTLVSYEFPFEQLTPVSQPSGHYCPDGTQFPLSDNELADMAADTALVNEAFITQLNMMSARGLPQKPLMQVEKPMFGYVRVMNVEPVQNSSGTKFLFWQQCSLYDEETEDLLGDFYAVAETQWGTIAELVATRPNGDTAVKSECPTGTLVLIERLPVTNLPILLDYETFMFKEGA